MKTLFILRHAKSSRDDPNLPDHDRPLNERGLKDAKQLGIELSHKGLMPNLIMVSTAKRAQETASLIIKHSRYQGDLKSLSELYGTDILSHIKVVNKTPDNCSTLMVIGHNPTLEDWVKLITDSPERLTTANLAKIELPINKWDQLRTETKGQLIALWRPWRPE